MACCGGNGGGCGTGGCGVRGGFGYNGGYNGSGCCSPCCAPCGVICGTGLKRNECRWPACNFLKCCLDLRVYRDCEHMNLSYAGHIPGEMYVYGRTLPVATTFAKRRLCNYIPYEYQCNDGTCGCPC